MTELKTMLEVAQAKERGEVVEYSYGGVWGLWHGEDWIETVRYRIQPKPKKTVKYCLWGGVETQEMSFGPTSFGPVDDPWGDYGWIRIPGTEVEVEQDD